MSNDEHRIVPPITSSGFPTQVGVTTVCINLLCSTSHARVASCGVLWILTPILEPCSLACSRLHADSSFLKKHTQNFSFPDGAR